MQFNFDKLIDWFLFFFKINTTRFLSLCFAVYKRKQPHTFLPFNTFTPCQNQFLIFPILPLRRRRALVFVLLSRWKIQSMGAAILPDLGAEILIPVCAVIGIAFALVQWVLVSNIKLSPARDASGNSPGAGGGKNGCTDYLIEEEEGLNDHNVVIKCAEIQSAISEGELFFPVL